MTELIPDNYKADHLILLVGGNPLPNAVAGRLLMVEGGTLTLVHTGKSGTQKIAQQLRRWFISQGISKGQIKLCATARNRSREIRDKLKNLVEKTPNSKSIGLNYTSGTSAMSVHAHAAVDAFTGSRKTIFSYLDAQTLCMRFDDEFSCYVGLPDFEFTIADLFILHGWEITKRKAPPFNENRCVKLDPQIYQDMFQSGKDGGKEFERDIYQQFLEIQHECGLSEIWMSTFATQKDLTSEFDVIALRGYQLFFCSCTITEPYKNYNSQNSSNEFKKNKRDGIKQKLFEAFIRARQIGGAEACAALACFIDDSTVEKEVEQTLQMKGRAKVFGRTQLGTLAHELKNWINEQSNHKGNCE